MASVDEYHNVGSAAAGKASDNGWNAEDNTNESAHMMVQADDTVYSDADKTDEAAGTGLVADDKGLVADDKGLVADDKGLVADDKGPVADDNGLVAAGKAH